MSILDRIDNTLAGDLCPCGADPRPNSAYCGPDCEPTHRSIDTTADFDGTQMRWRPDLVTAHNNSDLTAIDQYRRGQHNATVQRHPDGRIRYQLDDGHRYVAVDLDNEPGLTPTERRDTWQRLERELGNPRRTEPDRQLRAASDLWNGRRAALRAEREHTRERIADWLRANNIDPNVVPTDSTIRIRDGQITVDLWLEQDGEFPIDGDQPVTTPHTVPLIQPWPAGLRYEHLDTDTHPEPSGWHTIPFDTPTLQYIGHVLRRFHIAVAPIAERLRYFADVAYETQDEPADHPLARIRAQRRNQSHGPQRAQRPPRNITR